VVSLKVNNGVADAAPPAASGGEQPAEVRTLGRENRNLYCASEVRILVLDDDQAVCRVMHAALAPSDFKVDVIFEAGHVEAALRSQPYHLIILDYVIPGLESEQVLEWVREFQPDAGIIVVTAYPSIDSALNCLRARTYDYLTKPFQVATCSASSRAAWRARACCA
jgi:DNA-binding NtrC family response regulator